MSAPQVVATRARPRRLSVGDQLAALAGLAALRAIAAGDRRALGRARLAQRQLLAEHGAPRVTLRQSPVGLSQGYREWAATYDGPNLLITLEQRHVRPLLAAAPDGDALDVGCGTGRSTHALLGRGWQVIGVDRSAAMLAVARRSTPGVRFIRADLRHMPVAASSSALVVCALVLGHLRRVPAALRECARVLAPGGHLIVSDLHPLALALLGWRAGFTRATGERAFVATYPHGHEEYVQSFCSAGLTIDTYVEARIDERTAASYARALHAGRFETVVHDALIGLPALQIWRVRK